MNKDFIEVREITGMSYHQLTQFVENRLPIITWSRLYIAVREGKVWLIDDRSLKPEKRKPPRNRPWRWKQP